MTSSAASRRWAPWAALAALTALGLWLRWRAVPGPWGSDALGYAERALGDVGPAGDTRSQRVLFVAMLRAAFATFGVRPWAASVPGLVLSAAVGPVLFLALRGRCGPWMALVPALLWAALGLDVEETVEISADAATALPGALAAWALCRAASDRERVVRWLAAAGALAAAGFLLKETALFVVAGAVAGGLAVARVRGAAAAAGAAAIVVLGAMLTGLAPSLGVASHEMSWAPAVVRPDSPDFARRVTTAVPTMLLTATGAFGLMHVAALPLLARLPFRAFRGDPLAAAALGGIAAFTWAPISLETWGLLPATFPRYLLGVVPILLAALAATLAEAPSGRTERTATIVAAAAGLAFLGRGAWDVALVVALAATALTATPWGDSSLVATPSGDRPRVAAGARAAAVAALVAAEFAWTATPFARVAPERSWDLRLPDSGTVWAERRIGRRLILAAGGTPEARERVRLFDDAPPADVAAGDTVVVVKGSEAARRCVERGDLTPLDVTRGEAWVFTR